MINRRSAPRSFEGASAFVVLSDIFITVSFLLVILLTAVALTSSSTLRQLEIRSYQQKLARRIEKDFPRQWGRTLTEHSNGNIQRFTFRESLFFDTGSFQVKTGAGRLLDQLAVLLHDQARSGHITQIVVEGHTDAQPIGVGGIFRDNWDLSTLRSLSVVKYLIGRHVPGEFLTAVGRGEFAPFRDYSNPHPRISSTQRRSNPTYWPVNRRIEIVIVFAAGESGTR